MEWDDFVSHPRVIGARFEMTHADDERIISFRGMMCSVTLNKAGPVFHLGGVELRNGLDQPWVPMKLTQIHLKPDAYPVLIDSNTVQIVIPSATAIVRLLQ